MRAIVVETFGDPGVLRMVDLPIPEPGAGNVRIRVAAAGINPVDTYNVKDPTWAGIEPGCVLGYDLSGTVDAVGSGVDASARRAQGHGDDAVPQRTGCVCGVRGRPRTPGGHPDRRRRSGCRSVCAPGSRHRMGGAQEA